LLLLRVSNLQKMNLTSVIEINEVMERHIEDSLAIIPPLTNSYISHCNNSINKINLVDVGSGAGLPGLILAIACPGESLYFSCYVLH
jgi:16S rRNA (guanine527-N7)-methyltransferase